MIMMVYSRVKWYANWSNGVVPAMLMGFLFSFVLGSCHRLDTAIGEQPAINHDVQGSSIPKGTGVQQGIDRGEFVAEHERYIAIASTLVDAAEAIVGDLETFPSTGGLCKALHPIHLMRHIGNHYRELLGVGVGALAGLAMVMHSYSFDSYPELYLTDYLNMSTEFCADNDWYQCGDNHFSPMLFNQDPAKFPKLCEFVGQESYVANTTFRALFSAKGGKLWAMCKSGCKQLYQTFSKWDTQGLFPSSCSQMFKWGHDKNMSSPINSNINAWLDHSYSSYDVTYSFVGWEIPFSSSGNGSSTTNRNYCTLLHAFAGCADLFRNSTALLTELTGQQNHAREMISWGVWGGGIGLALLPFMPYVKACWQNKEEPRSIKSLLAKVKAELRDVAQQGSWHNLPLINDRVLALWSDIKFQLGQKKVKIYNLEGSDRVTATRCVEAIIEGVERCKGKMEQERLGLAQMADQGSLWNHHADCSDLVRQSMALLDKLAEICEKMQRVLQQGRLL